MKNYVYFGIFAILVLMIAGCQPQAATTGPVCGDGACDSTETAETCPADCEALEKAGAMVTVSPGVSNVNVGDEISVDVAVSEVTNLFGFQFDVGYDENILEFQQVEEGTFLNQNGEGNSFCIDYEATPGLIKRIACVKLGGQGIDGEGVLETLKFKAIGAGESKISLIDMNLADPSAEKIDVTTTDGAVVVS